jgi:SNF2 family DNA or RNA helicase
VRKDMLLQIFNEETSGNNHIKGQRVFANDLVSSLNITTTEDLLCIDGNVVSESLFNEYHTKIMMDGDKISIISTYCTCIDYEKNGGKKKNYCCKHLVAAFYKAVEDLAIHPLLGSKNKFAESLPIDIDKSNVLALLLGDEQDKATIKIEVYINKNEWDSNIYVEFKIGTISMASNDLFSIKDLPQFLLAYYSNFPVEYSKYFTFYTKTQKLSVKDRRLVEFISNLKELDGKYNKLSRENEKNIIKKYTNIPDYLTRDFFEIIKNHKVYLNEGFFYRPVETEIIHKVPSIDFDLKNIKDNYVLKSPLGMPISLSLKNDVFLFGTSIYLPDYEFCYKLAPYLQIFNQSKVIVISSSEEETILKKLIPDLYLLTPEVTLSKAIKDKIVHTNVNFNFYFDQEDSKVVLITKVQYGELEFNIFEDYKEKVIYRDSKKEQEVMSTLRNLGFEEDHGKFYLFKEDAYVYRFFKSEIIRLQELGEVYYSESFKGIKSIGSKGISGEIRAGKYDYFEMDFKIDTVPPQETAEILRAFRENLKFFKLKSGEFLDLEELKLKEFLKLLDVVASKGMQDNHVEIVRSKGFFVDSYIQENKIKNIDGQIVFKEMKNKFKNISKLKIKDPIGLCGTLREYQRIGCNWFKTLEHLGFGGILGDEMGLGKTLQTISFILSNRGSKTLIVMPTSLIYNWLSEFEKFAPTIRVASAIGDKNIRDEIILNIKNYDVIITTYNLLKRDLESYRDLSFDYFILDEAQYIKNPHSQNAVTVKEIKAKTRFALTGTPIENSLMDLWSIFDFIMPGYLYDEKRFSVRYHKKLNENPEVLEDLYKLIKPFILRRSKKEVTSELPDKIEKKLVVDLNDEQKTIYGTYAKHVVELIEKKVKDEEFNTSKIEILAYITKLRQLCLDPSVIMKEYTGGNGKLDALVELLNECIEERHRVLVFSQFTTVLKNIGKRIKAEGISFSYLDGSLSSINRMNLVKNFNEGDTSVFLISLKAGGVGLNLTAADIVIHYDPWWNPAVEEQATDRTHRIGQTKVVEVIKIIAKGTIEEKIVLLQEEKKKLISELLGDELSRSENLGGLSEKELLGLFEISPI